MHNFLPVRSVKEKELADYEVKARAERKHARIDTLSSVARSTALIVLWVWAALEILRNLGVNVAPIIASAGVVGLAVGFGAQSLVKDFLAGIFMLIEDQYGVGDTIDVGEVVGDVEEVTLRLTTLGVIDGTVWFVRNGQIERVGNFSQGYAIARIDFPVGLRSDFDSARVAIEKAARDAVQEADIKPMVLDEPSVQGIVSVKPDHAHIRISVKTLPVRQWAVQRRIYKVCQVVCVWGCFYRYLSKRSG